MKSTFLKRATIVTIILCTLLAAAGCAAQQDGPVSHANITITGADSVILQTSDVEFQNGDTVFDILKRVTQEEKIQMEFSGTGDSVFVLGIDNLYGGDNGPMSGWLFSVNDTPPAEGCGAIEVQEGDCIKWTYTLDFTQ